jgi:hypothetical protein
LRTRLLYQAVEIQSGGWCVVDTIALIWVHLDWMYHIEHSHTHQKLAKCVLQSRLRLNCNSIRTQSGVTVFRKRVWARWIVAPACINTLDALDPDDRYDRWESLAALSFFVRRDVRHERRSHRKSVEVWGRTIYTMWAMQVCHIMIITKKR